ncbi:NAD(+) diphosphatase [Candidatus Bipolaricaulota bacterium]|nr:NAD(+) diphosphatase [Candidatus Bipolaricaulota bacterium]
MNGHSLPYNDPAEDTTDLSFARSGADSCPKVRHHRDPRFILFCGDGVVLESGLPIRPRWFRPHELAGLTLDERTGIDLGADDLGPRMALDLSGMEEAEQALGLSQGAFRSLKAIQEPIDPCTWRILSRAQALLIWNQQSAICPACGAATESQGGGTLRVCTDPGCARIHYPRTDPSVIVRVVSGERCLLARQPKFRAGLKSVLAGFVEPGETLEEAVRREVAEEVGIVVDRIEYLASQPWPFPMNLMIAFQAHARDEEIALDSDELEIAEWYTRERAERELAEGALILPSRKSISRWMIDEWLDGC